MPRIGPVEAPDLGDEELQQARFHATVDEHVVGRDARLAGVDEFPVRDAAGDDREVRVSGDDGRGLPAQLERYRGQVRRRGLHDDPPDARVPRVEDVVEPLGEERLGLLDASLDDRDPVRVQVAPDQPGEGLRCRGRELGGLAHHRITGGDRGRHRGEKELDRVVPRRDHERHADRLPDDPRAGRLQHPANPDAFRAHPRVDVAEQPVDLAEDERDLADPGLDRRPAQVLAEGRLQRARSVAEEPLHRAELRPAPRQRTRAPGLEPAAEPADDFRGRPAGRGIHGIHQEGHDRRSSRYVPRMKRSRATRPCVRPSKRPAVTVERSPGRRPRTEAIVSDERPRYPRACRISAERDHGRSER